MRADPFSTRETVARETPARWATSALVAIYTLSFLMDTCSFPDFQYLFPARFCQVICPLRGKNGFCLPPRPYFTLFVTPQSTVWADLPLTSAKKGWYHLNVHVYMTQLAEKSGALAAA